MLTNDLLRYKIDSHTIQPRYLTRKHANYYLKIAQDLIDVFEKHRSRSRFELDQALGDYENDQVGFKIQRGLAKILEGFAEFEASQDSDFADYRRVLFQAAEKFRPIVREPDLVHQNTRDLVLAKIEAELGTPPSSLYGDLPDQQIMLEFKRGISPEKVIRRYNLALAQGLLYRCSIMRVRVWDTFKTVFRYLKLAQLMHKITKDGESYQIEIDGPFSLFKRTQKYGVNLARFLPGLLLAQKWQMTAQVNTEEGERYFYLDQNCGLTTHYRKENPFDSSVEEAFYNNFNKRKTDWKIERESEIVDLGDVVLIPDFKFVHPDGREALLEIVGFWTPEYLAKKLEKLQRANRQNLIVAVSESLNCSKDDFSGPVVFIKTRLKVSVVLKLLDDVIDP